LFTFSLSRALSGWAVCPSPSVFPSLVVVVFAAAVLLQGVAAQGAQQDAPLAVPPALEPERDVPRVAQYVVQAARLAPDALRAARSDALLGAPQVLGELLAAHWDALRADLRDDSLAVHWAALLADPRDAPPVPGELLAARSAALRADLQDDLLAGLPAAHSDVSPGDPQAGQPDDCLAVRLAGDHY
jgi:hypothetical protein